MKNLPTPTDTCDMTKKIQNKVLSMLVTLDEILTRNNIPYYLAYGTTLGCIRHRGFIPWDDDIDIYIAGEYLPALQKVFEEQDTGNLILDGVLPNKEYPYSFPKIIAKDTVLVEASLRHLKYQCGIYIDIFPLITLSDHLLVRRFQETARYIDYVLLRAYYFRFDSTFRKLFTWLVQHTVSPEKIQARLYHHYVRKGQGRFVGDSGFFHKKAILKKEWFERTERLPFEGHLLPVPALYDEYLTHCYGDYMQLPPENQRISNHNFVQVEFL